MKARPFAKQLLRKTVHLSEADLTDVERDRRRKCF